MSCKDVVLPTPESENIIGEWEWVESVGGLSGLDRRTPESVRETYQLIFRDNGKYRYCIDNEKSDKGTYSIEEKVDSSSSYLEVSLHGDKSSTSILSFQTNDSMSLFPVSCTVCYNSVYVRK
ncbi:MAG: hypothetical protein COA58_15325 [Bacteroidetes bacterium]|nr:MAG: hypothetical protein COA58_15325 [Bacteroidota bacterium]